MRLLTRENVCVLHACAQEVRLVEDEERQELLRRLDAFFRGSATPVSDLELAEFRDREGRLMLVVQEYC